MVYLRHTYTTQRSGMEMLECQKNWLTQFAATLGLFIGIGCLGGARAELSPGLRDKNRDTWGSGVLISREGHVVTNRHVVPKGCSQAWIEDFKGNRSQARVLQVSTSDDVAILATDRKSDPNRDVHAIFRINEAQTHLLLPRLNESVHISGYPAGEFGPRGGLVSDLQDPVHKERGFTIGLKTTYGASGSPVFDNDGLLIGIVWGGHDDPALATAYAMSTVVLLPLLRSEGIKTSRSTPTEAPYRALPGEPLKTRIAQLIGIGMQATVKVFCLQ